MNIIIGRDPGVDDCAVARRGLNADSMGCLGDDDFALGWNQSLRRREADNAGPDHRAIGIRDVSAEDNIA